MANKKISELSSRTPALSDLMIVGDPSSGYSYKCSVTALATIIETDIADGYVTIGTTQTISGAKTFSNNLTLTSVANATTTQTKFLTLNGSNVVNYRTGAEVLTDIGGQASLSGTGLVKSTSGTISYITDNSSNWNTAYNDSIVSAAVSGTTTKTLTLTQQDGGTLTASWSDLNTDAVTSVFGRTGAVVATEGDYSLNLLSDVTITSPSNGQVLKYNGTAWVNDTDANTGTVTSVGLSSATSGVTIGSTPITTSGTITLAIATASGSQQGLLSSTDWTTFNNKQNAITLTTTGTSGAATLVGSTLNIPQYQAALTNPVTGTGTTNYIPKFTSSSAIGNSQIFDNGTSVGINTITPSASYKLDVNGYARASSFYVSSGASGGGFIFDAGGNAGIGIAQSGNILQYYTGGSERMRLDASGNLIVGGTSAVETSSGRGNITINGSSNSILALSTGGVSKGYLYNDGTDITLYSGNILRFGTNSATRLTLDASGNLGLGVTPSAWSSYTGFQIGTQGSIGATSTVINLSQNVYYGASGNSYIANGKAAMYQMNDGEHNWRIAGTGTAGNAISFTQAMTLDASGRLGIGTTSPAYTLQVAGIGKFEVQSGATNNTAPTALIVANKTTGAHTSSLGSSLQFEFTNSGGAYSGGLISSVGGADPFTADLRFSARNYGYVEAMRITSGGNVGIGTTSPAYKLEVSHNDQLAGLIAGVGTSIAQNNGGAILAIRNTNNTNGNMESLLFQNSAGTAVAAILGYNTNHTTGEGLMTFGTRNSGGTFAEQMRITSGGNVGIGTTSPAYTLDVNGTGRFTAPNSTAEGLVITGRASDGASQISINNNGGSSLAYIYNTSSESRYFANTGIYQSFWAGGSERMRITSGGQVGIGLTNPTAALEVNGGIKTSAPLGGTAQQWKFGSKVNATVVLITGSYIELEVGGTLYKLALVN